MRWAHPLIRRVPLDSSEGVVKRHVSPVLRRQRDIRQRWRTERPEYITLNHFTVDAKIVPPTIDAGLW